MVRAFPRLHNGAVRIGISFRIHFPEPFGTGSLIDHMISDKCPFLLCGFQIFRFLRLFLIAV